MSAPSHRLRFKMPACHRHFFKGHKWWCRACDQHTESEMREVVHELWKLQGAGDRIDYPTPHKPMADFWSLGGRLYHVQPPLQPNAAPEQGGSDG